MILRLFYSRHLSGEKNQATTNGLVRRWIFQIISVCNILCVDLFSRNLILCRGQNVNQGRFPGNHGHYLRFFRQRRNRVPNPRSEAKLFRAFWAKIYCSIWSGLQSLDSRSNIQSKRKFPAIFSDTISGKSAGNLRYFRKIRSFSSNFLKNCREFACREFPFRLYRVFNSEKE